MRIYFIGAIHLCLLWNFLGCTHSPGIGKNWSPQELFERACEPGQHIHSVHGTAWLKIQSQQISGQFPLSLSATAPNQMKLEVTNFFGGTEVLIDVQGEHYLVTRPDSGNFNQETGSGSWGGIPLKWATYLFFGKIPCPASSDQLRLSTPEAGELRVLVSEYERFIYRFRDRKGKPWPESLHWERVNQSSLFVDFKFDDPDDLTLSPKKWEAQSSSGSIKVRWKERQVSYDPH